MHPARLHQSQAARRRWARCPPLLLPPAPPPVCQPAACGMPPSPRCCWGALQLPAGRWRLQQRCSALGPASFAPARASWPSGGPMCSVGYWADRGMGGESVGRVAFRGPRHMRLKRGRATARLLEPKAGHTSNIAEAGRGRCNGAGSAAALRPPAQVRLAGLGAADRLHEHSMKSWTSCPRPAAAPHRAQPSPCPAGGRAAWRGQP